MWTSGQYGDPCTRAAAKQNSPSGIDKGAAVQIPAEATANRQKLEADARTDRRSGAWDFRRLRQPSDSSCNGLGSLSQTTTTSFASITIKREHRIEQEPTQLQDDPQAPPTEIRARTRVRFDWSASRVSELIELQRWHPHHLPRIHHL